MSPVPQRSEGASVLALNSGGPKWPVALLSTSHMEEGQPGCPTALQEAHLPCPLAA